MMKYILCLSLIILVTGCSKKKKEAKTSIVISMGALVGSNYSGGALLRAVNTVTGNSIDFVLVDPYLATIPFGTWNLYFYGFDGGSAWTGPGECGEATNVNLAADVTVSITANYSNCSDPKYIALRATKDTNLVGVWDDANSKWDQSVWGP